MAILASWSGTDLPTTVIGSGLTLDTSTGLPTQPSLLLTQVTGSTGHARIEWTAVAGVAVRFYLQTPASWPTATGNVLTLKPGSSGLVGAVALAGDTEAGRVRLIHGGNNVAAQSPSGTLALSTWYRVEVRFDSTAGQARLGVFPLESDTALWDSGWIAHATFSTGIGRVEWGRNSTSPTFPPYRFDSFEAVDSSADWVGRATGDDLYVPPTEPAAVLWRWAGAVTPTAFTVAARLTSITTTRLAYSTNPALTSPSYTSSTSADAQGCVKYALTGLTAGTVYYYAVEWDIGAGWVRDTVKLGQVKTFPAAGAANTRVIHSNCHAKGSTNHIFGYMQASGASLFLHTGDFHYDNIDLGDDDETARETYRQPYTANLTTPVQDAFYGVMPVAYTWDDHDFCGDNSNKDDVGRANVAKVYRQCVPHYPLHDSAGVGIWQTWALGKVRYIMLDCRAYRTNSSTTDSPSKTMLGSEQLAWLKSTLLASTEEIFVIVSSIPWNDHDTGASDSWGRFKFEQNHIVAWLEANHLTDSVVMVNGDMHGLAADDGTNAPGALPTVIGGAVGSSGSYKGGPYSHGYLEGNGHYGRLDFTGVVGGASVEFTGRLRNAGVDVAHLTMPITLVNKSAAAASGIVSVGVWDGTTVVPATAVSVWDGTTLVAASFSSIT